MIDTGALGCQWANGGTDCGYNVQTISADGLTVYSEWAHLYYVTMGNLAHAAGPLDTMLVNTGDFLNFEVAALWTGVADAKFPAYAWVFQFYDGYQYSNGQINAHSGSLAVRPGDVNATVPEPQSLALALLAVGAAVLASRKRPR